MGSCIFAAIAIVALLALWFNNEIREAFGGEHQHDDKCKCGWVE